MVVYKYPIRITSNQVIEMRPGKILHVGLDPDGFPCVWAQVSPTGSFVKKELMIFGTGESFELSGIVYVGTLIKNGYVWHVYECA